YLPHRADSTPNGIRTRVAAVKGRCPRPLDDGSSSRRRLDKNIRDIHPYAKSPRELGFYPHPDVLVAGAVHRAVLSLNDLEGAGRVGLRPFTEGLLDGALEDRRLLGPADGVFAVEDEEGHTRDTELTGLVDIALDIIGVGVGLQHRAGVVT